MNKKKWEKEIRRIIGWEDDEPTIRGYPRYDLRIEQLKRAGLSQPKKKK